MEQGKDNKPNMPKFNMTWLYITILAALAVLWFTSNGSENQSGASGGISKKENYKKLCGGKVPRLKYVKGFSGILIHSGVDQNSSAGCIIVGQNKQVGKVINSWDTFKKLYARLKAASDKGEKITITIQ